MPFEAFNRKSGIGYVVKNSIFISKFKNFLLSIIRMIVIKNENEINKHKLNPHKIVMTDEEYFDVYNKNKQQIDTLIKNTVYYQSDYNKVIIRDNQVYFQNLYHYIFKINQIPEMMIFFTIIKYGEQINYDVINLDLSDRLNRLIIEIRLGNFSTDLNKLNKRLDTVEKKQDMMSFGSATNSRKLFHFR
jgi:hypothetical protein